MSDDDDMIGHNSGVDKATAAQLNQYLQRIENLVEEKKGIQEDIKEVFAEAKSQGFDPATMRQVLKIRAMDKAKREEQEALLETYLAALDLVG